MKSLNLTTQAKAGNAEAQAQLAQQALIRKDKDAAWKWANLSAAQNCPYGIYVLGICCEGGLNTEKDLEKANRLYQKAVDMGCVRALVGLAGVMIEKERKVSREARALLRKAADANDAKALYMLATIYADGANVVRSRNRCRQLLEKAAAQDYAPAMYDLSWFYLDETDTALYDKKKGHKLIKQAAKQGYPIAEVCLGDLIQTGEMGKVDNDKAFKLFAHAASTDCPEGVRSLGYCYLYGEGVEADAAIAEKYFKHALELGLADCEEMIEIARNGEDSVNAKEAELAKAHSDYRDKIEAAAAEGDPEALYQQAGFYKSGEVSDLVKYEQNESKVFECITKSAEAGYAQAAFILGCIYDYGHCGLQPDRSTAMFWYRKAAEQGNAKAMTNLGCCFQKIGISDEAVTWLEKACDAGDDMAFGMLSIHYLHGMGVEKDVDKAFALAKQGADLGDAEGDKMLGLCYLLGSGVEQDTDTAVDWLISASNKGNEVAMLYLGRIFMGDYGDEYTDYELAEEQFFQSANAGNACAAYELGRFYVNFTHEYEKAYYAFATAAEWGHPEAKAILKAFK
jgi:hypothetical protein